MTICSPTTHLIGKPSRLTPGIAFRAVELSEVHQDPADRFIIATALENDLPVLTTDGNFAKYGVDVIC